MLLKGLPFHCVSLAVLLISAPSTRNAYEPSAVLFDQCIVTIPFWIKKTRVNTKPRVLYEYFCHVYPSGEAMRSKNHGNKIPIMMTTKQNFVAGVNIVYYLGLSGLKPVSESIDRCSWGSIYHPRESTSFVQGWSGSCIAVRTLSTARNSIDILPIPCHLYCLLDNILINTKTGL